MVNDKEIMSKLLIDEKDTEKLVERSVEKAQKIFRIESKSGRIIFNDINSLTEKQKICSLLVSRYFAFKLGLVESDSLNGSSIAAELGSNENTVWGKLSELTQEGIIERREQKYKVHHYKIESVLDGILTSIQKCDSSESQKQVFRQRKVFRTKNKDKDEVLDNILQSLDRTKYPLLSKLSMALDKALYILKIIKDDLNVDGLTPLQIAIILTEKFRIPITREAISMALYDDTEKVDRVSGKEKSRAYTYRIMSRGEEYINNLLQKIGADA
jgi:biotin operon repressor